MSIGLALGLSVVLLALNAFFVGAEFALVSARRSSIEPRAADGSRIARLTVSAMERVSLMIAGAQLGITICTVGLGYVGKPAVAHLLEGPLEAAGIPSAAVYPITFALALALVGYLHVVIGEMVPKNIALARPDRSALALAPPLVLVVRLLHPIIAFLNWVANTTLRLAGVTPKDEVTSAFTRDEVAGLVEESRREGLIDPHEGRLLVGALEFEDRTVRSVLLDGGELTTVAATITPAELERIAARTGHSRFPVTGGDGLIGYLHVKDVLETEDRHRNRPIAERWIRPLPVLRETDRLRAALARMQRSGAHMAQVRGADGTLLGVVALEDVLEELVGEIRDEASSRAA
ncbi:MAG: HlyC/CorC family transporter [Solirubrobacterales bacterium]|nr:HlyC/CorC family transporter [Solirubrobacterales bacterium]